MNTTTDQIKLSVYDLINMSILVAIMIIGVFGNTLIVYVFGWKRRSRIKRFENFLLLLAVVDLVASFVIPMSFFYLTSTKFKRWDFGETGCRIIPSLLQISITLSHGVLILISYERYHTLVKPFQERIGRLAICIWLLFVIVLSVGLVAPYMITFTVYESEAFRIKTCMPDAEKIDYLMLSSFLQVLRDILAIGGMVLLNQRMNHALTKQHRNVNWSRDKMSRKGRKLLLRIIIIFSALTIPVDLFQATFYSMIMAEVPITQDLYQVLTHVNTFLNIVQTSNSMVNVFIYSRMHDMFQLQWCLPQQKRRQRRNTCLTETEYLTNKTVSRQSSYLSR